MKESDGQNMQSAILHDAYFNRPPNLIGLFLIRLGLLCALSACMVWCLTDLYLLTERQLFLCGAAALASALVFTAASLLPSGSVYFSLLVVGGGICWILRDPLTERLRFFWDALMLRLESRLLATKPLILHSYTRLKAGYYEEKLEEGWLTGMLLLIALLAVFLTLCTRTRFRPIPVLLVIGLLSAPAFAAEISGFHPSVIALAAVFAALCTVCTGYELDGHMVFGKSRAANEALRRNERSYQRRTRFYLLGRKLRSDLPRYFKYNANSFLALLVTAGVLLGTAAAIPDGQGFDYEAFLSALQDAGVAAADQIGGVLGVTFGSVDDSGYFSYSSYGDSSGGIGISEPSKGNLPVLSVVLDRNDIPVYLRGDIGVQFTGSAWTAIRDEYERFTDPEGVSYASQLDAFYPDLQYQVLRQRLSSLGYNPDRLLPLQNVSVSYRRSTKVVFQPIAAYELSYKENANFESFGDCVLRTRPGKGTLKTFECLSLTPCMDNSYMSEAVTSARYSGDLSWTLPDGVSNAEYAALIGKYHDFVQLAYMETDSAVLELNEEMRRLGYIGGLSEFDTAAGVCRYFRENFSYSLTEDNGTAEESLKNFLYRTKRGHCALFASAAVLSLRELGIPARYVTGYVASGEGEQTAEGRYRYTLLESDLHAWIEVYFENVGWLPFDPTAAVSGFGEASAEPAQSDAAPEQTEPAVSETEAEVTTVTGTTAEEVTAENPEVSDEPEHESVQPEIVTTEESEPSGDPAVPEHQTNPSNPAPAQEKRSIAEIFAALLPYLTFAAVAAALLAAAILFVRGVGRAEKHAWRGFYKKPPGRAVREMYQLAVLLLTREGLAPGAETLTDYAVRADASPLLKGANVFLTDVMPVFMKCEFGNPEISPVTEEERLAAAKFTSALYRRVMEKKSAFGKFFTKISLFL